MRVVEPGEDDAGTGTDIGRHGGLGPGVLPGLHLDADLTAGSLGEGLRVLKEDQLVASHELGGAHDPQGSTLLHLELRCRGRQHP